MTEWMGANRWSIRGQAARDCRVSRRMRGFTVIEIVVVIGIIAVLVSLMLPALQKCRSAARNLKCASQLQNIAFEFRLFADDFAAQTRGGSDALGPRFFYVEDFQEKMYGLAEFWDSPGTLRADVDPTKSPMLCPEGKPALKKRALAPCSSGAVFPKQNVSLAFNRRLYRPGPFMKPVMLTGKILDHPDVPLAMDVDGESAFANRKDPYYVAPPTDQEDGYQQGAYWFPGMRHGQRLNAAFVGGQVESSRHPASEPTWKWSYQPDTP